METELPPQESEGKTAPISMLDLGSGCDEPRDVSESDPASLTPPPLSSDLFQDLSQLQETWLTEGENSSLFLFCLVLLWMISSPW